jgi:peptidoglycan/xylan/chitin deacetylase (PgdA/CDA1 family)
MIKEMSDSELVKFESHTLSHPDLTVISSNDARLTDEIADSKTKIEEITGKPVVALAYPAGKFNETVKTKAKEFYLFGLRADLGMHRTDFDSFEIRRIRINRSTSLANFINAVG